MITIGIPKIKKTGKQVRLTCEIESNEYVKDLWIEVDKKYERYLVKDRCDAFLTAILPIAMRMGKDIICCSPVSEELLHNIRTTLIPTLVKYGDGFYKTRISADSNKHVIKNAGAVGMQFNCGIGAMHTVNNYTDSDYNSMNITNICITDTGYFDIAGFYENKKDGDKIKEECIEKALSAAKELDIPHFLIKSNYAKEFNIQYAFNHFYCELFPILALQKMFKTYYIPTYGYDYSTFSVTNSAKLDCSRYELLLDNVFSTGYIKIISEGAEKNFLEQIEDITHFGTAQKYLHVCMTDSKNCGKCRKCIKTMLALDAIGKLDNFAQVFDINYYNKNKKIYTTLLETGHNNNDVQIESVYQQFDKRKMLASSTPIIINENIEFNSPLNTQSLLVKNLSSGEILMKKQTKEIFPAVGFTKIMTALIALESGNSQLMIDIPPTIANGLTKATIYDLINILILSANDEVADIIAENIENSIGEFVDIMNQKAAAIGLPNTKYSSPSGRDKDSYTTAEDTLKLMEYAFKNIHFCKIFKNKNYLINSGDREVKIPNLNRLLLRNSEYYMSECIAAKFGLIGSYANMVAVAEKQDIYLAILMGTREEGTSMYRFRDTKNLLDAALKLQTLPQEEQEVGRA